MNLTITPYQILAMDEAERRLDSTIVGIEQAVERAEQNAKLTPEELALLQHESSEAVREDEDFQARLSDWRSERYC